jgi:SAM-dependent methyltransferase
MKLEHVTCDLCSSAHYRVRYRIPDLWLWLEDFEYPVVECSNCRLVYVNPRPTIEEMGRFYPAGYHENRDSPQHLDRYKNQFEFISSYGYKTVLDIGCAEGDWLEYLSRNNDTLELYGVDAFSERVKGDSIKFQKSTLVDAHLPEKYFDLITAWAVLEHVHTPSSYFKSVSKLLKPNGKFVFLVTNSQSIYGKYAYKEDVPRHLYHFDEQSLSAYASKYQLRIDKIDYDERFWDGSGKGAFYHMMRKLLLLSMWDIKFRPLSIFHWYCLRFGSILDKLFFSIKWEKKIRRSGIIVVTMSKNQ